MFISITANISLPALEKDGKLVIQGIIKFDLANLETASVLSSHQMSIEPYKINLLDRKKICLNLDDITNSSSKGLLLI